MMTPKELRHNVNQLSQISDLILQMERQVSFWRGQARNQLKKNHKLHKELIISKSDLTYDELTESWYYVNADDTQWRIFDDNMYAVDDEHRYTLIQIPVKDSCNIGVLLQVRSITYA